jgi:hypothetical protein
VIVFGHQELRDSELKKLLLYQLAISPICLLLGPHCALRHKNIEIRKINNYAKASKSSSKSRTSVTLNQKLEIIKLHAEDMYKVEMH